MIQITAMQLADRLERGELRAVEVATAHLDAAARDGKVNAWTSPDPEHVMLQARMLDNFRTSGHPIGSLDANRRPQEDAFVVARLQEAGAIVMGKTATTELAIMHPFENGNPHDPTRIPDGSASGSAAVITASMAPLALRPQTNGSVIRSASFCGVVGYKPSHGLVSQCGVLSKSPTLDNVGVLACGIEDVALLADVLAVYDEADRTMQPQVKPRFLGGESAKPPLAPVLAFARTPVWDRAEASTHAAFTELREELGVDIDELNLPPAFDHVHQLHRTIMLTDIARSFGHYDATAREQLSKQFRTMIDEGRRMLAVGYALAKDLIGILNSALDCAFGRYGALMTPATGEDPLGLTSTGDPGFFTIWTYRGVPAITLPLLEGENRLPTGMQLVGQRGNDAPLLRTAKWLMRRFGMNASG